MNDQLLTQIAELQAAQTREILDRVGRVENLVIDMRATTAADAARITAVEAIANDAAETARNVKSDVRVLRNSWHAAAALFGSAVTLLGTYLRSLGKS